MNERIDSLMVGLVDRVAEMLEVGCGPATLARECATTLSFFRGLPGPALSERERQRRILARLKKSRLRSAEGMVQAALKAAGLPVSYPSRERVRLHRRRDRKKKLLLKLTADLRTAKARNANPDELARLCTKSIVAAFDDLPTADLPELERHQLVLKALGRAALHTPELLAKWALHALDSGDLSTGDDSP